MPVSQPVSDDLLPKTALDQLRMQREEGSRTSVTRAELAERALRQQYLFLQKLIDTIPDLIFVKDRACRVTLANRAFCEALGRAEEEIIGKTSYELYPPEIADVFQKMDDRLFKTGEPARNEEWFAASDGRTLRLDITKIPYFAQSGDVVGVIAIARDITERSARDEERNVLVKQLQSALKQLAEERRKLRDANEQLTLLSQRDGLTGVHNRRALDEQLELEWNRCRRASSSLAFILFDIDHFKAYNDHYGHLAGDDCLRQVAAVLTQQAHRAADFVARYGGEEFAVLLAGGDMETAESVAEACRQNLFDMNIPHEGSAEIGRVTISGGIATLLPDADHCIEDLIQQADDNLYLAKRTRNSVRS